MVTVTTKGQHRKIGLRVLIEVGLIGVEIFLAKGYAVFNNNNTLTSYFVNRCIIECVT